MSEKHDLIRFSHARRASRGRQRGATILIALILLLSLAIAAVAVVRSSDSSVMVAGNAAVKIDALNQAELGVATAVMMARTHLSALGAANSNQTARNYVAALLPSSDGSGIPDVLRDGASTAFSSSAFRSAYTAAAVPTQNGVVVNYLIERMCDPLISGQEPEVNFCHLAVDLGTPSGNSNETREINFGEPVVFRVTVRVDQPNQSAPTFVQEYFTAF